MLFFFFKLSYCRSLPICFMCSLCVHSLSAANMCHCNPGIEIVGQRKQIVRKILKKKFWWLKLVELVKRKFVHLNLAYSSQTAAPSIGAARTTSETTTKMSRALKKHLNNLYEPFNLVEGIEPDMLEEVSKRI